MAFILGIARPVEAQESDRSNNLKFELSTGYSTENLEWSIAGKNTYGEPVNILSELKWKKLGGIYLNLSGEWYVWKDLFVRGNFSKTFIASGSVTDTDFGKHDRRDTLFHDKFTSNKGGLGAYGAAAGYKIHFLKKHSIATFAGYGSDSQSLYILRDNGNVQGDLKSTYQTRWNGFFTGIDIRISIHKNLAAKAQITYHQLSYSATADWNLIEDFKHPVSFKHRAKGYGFATDAGLEYFISKRMSATLTTTYSSWTTGKGTDTLYRTNGDVAITQLNRVQRNNLIFSAGFQITFN